MVSLPGEKKLLDKMDVLIEEFKLMNQLLASLIKKIDNKGD